MVINTRRPKEYYCIIFIERNPVLGSLDSKWLQQIHFSSMVHQGGRELRTSITRINNIGDKGSP